jgi:hypothetical protein
MSHQELLAHQLAAGFLEQASHFAVKFGPENLHDAMHRALSNLLTDYSGACVEEISLNADGEPTTRKAIVLACKMAIATLSADTRTVN